MSETVGIIVLIAGLAASGGGFYLLNRSQRQVLGFLVIFIGFTVAGIGLLAVDDTQVEERPTATQEATPSS